MHTLEREITLDVGSDELWDFIATPLNLNDLTPPELHFRILSEVPEKMYEGLAILYEIDIAPFGRHKWLTEIKHVREGVSFVDEQRIGPYKFWYHHHEVVPVAGGRSKMLDRVFYKLPFGLVGGMVQAVWVRQKLDGIFAYREQRLLERFGPQ